jgi:hypothetical protein
MSEIDSRWVQMVFDAPDGRREVLWVQPAEEDDTYRVLNVPVWLYGVSVGTRVRGRAATPWLVYDGTVEQARGGTVRVFVHDEARATPASRFYLDVLLPACEAQAIGAGPATFFDPLVVAVHFHSRPGWQGPQAELLNKLARDGALEFWELGDPDPGPREDEDPDEAEDDDGEPLVHERPTPSRAKHF